MDGVFDRTTRYYEYPGYERVDSSQYPLVAGVECISAMVPKEDGVTYTVQFFYGERGGYSLRCRYLDDYICIRWKSKKLMYTSGQDMPQCDNFAGQGWNIFGIQVNMPRGSGNCTH